MAAANQDVPTSSRRSGAPNTAHTQLPESQRSQAAPRSVASNKSVPGMFSKTLNNRSSVKHNIITGGDNIYSHEMKPKILDKSVYNIKKGVTEIRNLAGPNSINRNPDHVRAVDENADVFKR